MSQIYTIGYACHTITSFGDMLVKYGITAVADVRSSPYSQFKPEFNRESLSAALRRLGITYVFLGDACGARPNDAECYVDNAVSFERLASRPEFQEGLTRLQKGIERFTIAILCAEKDPISCHRTILISRHLCHRFGLKVHHILEDGTCEEHSETEERLLKRFDLAVKELPGLGRSREERLAEAYKCQAERIAHRKREDAEEAAEVTHA